MGKQKGQTQDYRVGLRLPGGTKDDRRWRGDYRVALIMARDAIRKAKSAWSTLSYVDPVTRVETEIVRYDAEHPPPADDADLDRPSLNTSRVWDGVPAGAYACTACGKTARVYSMQHSIRVGGRWRPKVVCPDWDITAGVRRRS